MSTAILGMTSLAALPAPPGNGFHLGPLFVHAYGLAYIVAIAAAVRLTEWRWAHAGGNRALVGEVALWGVPAGLLGARLYFLATSWDQSGHEWWAPLAVWQGGLGLWGGIAGGTLGGLVALHRRGVAWAPFLDIAAPGLLVAQAIGRTGNWFNQELYGKPTLLPWGLRIDADQRAAGYERFVTFHPAFLYELVFDLVLAAALIALARRSRLAPGSWFAVYVAGYSAFRVYIETLRIDPAHHIFGLRLNVFVALAVTGAATAWLLRANAGGKGAARDPIATSAVTGGSRADH